MNIPTNHSDTERKNAPKSHRQWWLILCQAVTVGLSLWWLIGVLQPQWLSANKKNNGTLTPLTVPTKTATQARTPPNSFRTAAERAAPAVVSIHVRKAMDNPHRDDPWFRFFYGDLAPEEQTAVGSGVIVRADGYALTNHHVVESADEAAALGATSINVQLNDGHTLPAELVGTDPDSDLAVLKIHTPDNAPLPAIEWGDVRDAQVGDWVLAIGTPYGVGQTVTSGIISGLGRNSLGLSTFENFIQTDAAINPGNSGGALTDAQGRLVGINTAIFSRSGGNVGIGFAIPEDVAHYVLGSIVEHGYVKRGWIGVEPRRITPTLAQLFQLPPEYAQQHVVIVSVLKNGPAHIAGIQPGDVVLRVNDEAMTTVAQLLHRIGNHDPDTSLTLTIERNGKTQTIQVQPVQRPTRSVP